jgi:hypothetical protein
MKVLICLGICFLLLGIPIAIAAPNSIETTLNSMSNHVTQRLFDRERTIIEPTNDPPAWANGNFSGVWGFSIWGEWEIPVGWTYGYYKRNPTLGYFYAKFGNFEEENTSWFIQGYFIGPFMFGSIGENESANETLFVGIGRINETDYHWRMMGEVGPTFFVEGTYTKFE